MKVRQNAIPASSAGKMLRRISNIDHASRTTPLCPELGDYEKAAVNR